MAREESAEKVVRARQLRVNVDATTLDTQRAKKEGVTTIFGVWGRILPRYLRTNLNCCATPRDGRTGRTDEAPTRVV